MLSEEKIGYSCNQGLSELCEAIRCYHGALPGHSVVVTNGSQEALFDTFLALLGQGDEVLVPDPGFTGYASVARLAGAVPVFYPLRRQNHFQLAEGELKGLISHRTRAIVLNSPSNPTSQCLNLAQLRFVSQLAQEKRLVVISDEIYREIYYGQQKPPAIAQISNDAVILSGVSKMANMTGWRVGWACGPPKIIEKVTVVHQYSSSCASTLAQKAALQVFSEAGQKAITRQRKRLGKNCHWVCSQMDTDWNRPYVRPQGAFYLLLSVEDLGLDSFSVSLELLEDGVATIPGAAFGLQSEGFLRISFACGQSMLEAGLVRLKRGLGRLIRRTRV